MRERAAELRKRVCQANLELVRAGLVMETFGNVSGLDRDAGVFYIKPSGVPYEELTPEAMVPVSLESGRALGTSLRPSSDTPIHLELYRAFSCGGVAHTHSEAATTLAQAHLPVRCMGTTHADYFHGDVPVTRDLTLEEIEGAYETSTGLVIIETFRERGISSVEVPAALVAGHGPFTWGEDAEQAVKHSIVLEYVARMDCGMRSIGGMQERLSPSLASRHFLRKHGPGAYYGQKEPGLPRAVLWDLDGTLADSRDHHWRSWKMALAAEDVTITEAQFLASFGQRNDAILSEWLGPEADPDRIRHIGEAKEEAYRRLVRTEGIQPLPGAAQWVRALHEAGWRQAIASSAPRLNVEVMHEALGFAGIIDVLVGAEDVSKGKPDPEVFLLAAERLGVEPERCVVVEDAQAGIEAARWGGMRSIGVGTGSLVSADLVVRSLNELAPGTFDGMVP